MWGNPAGLYDGKALLVVVVGGIATGLVAYPFGEVRRISGIVRKALFSPEGTVRKLIEQIVGFAETARREGILALEKAIQDVDDSFMATGIRLAVDGTHPELVQSILKTELTFLEERHAEGQRLLRVLGIGWGAFPVPVGLLRVLVTRASGGSSRTHPSVTALPQLPHDAATPANRRCSSEHLPWTKRLCRVIV